MLNPVGDPAYDTIKGKSEFVKKTVGPVDPNKYIISMSKDRPDVYCNICTKLTVKKILLEYMDGTEDVVDMYYSAEMWNLDGAETSSENWNKILQIAKRDHPDFSNSLS